MKRIAPSERMEQEISEALRVSQDPLGEAARRGAQLILQRVLEAEVDEFLGRGRYERAADGAVRGHRNGYAPKRVQLAEGGIELAVPQIRDSVEPFESVWLAAIGKRSARLRQLIPMLYVRGMSQRDVEAALVEALGVEQTGRTVITEVCKALRPVFRALPPVGWTVPVAG